MSRTLRLGSRMRIIPLNDAQPGYEGYVHDLCSACGGVVCGFLHSGDHSCDCGEEVESGQ